MGIFELVHYLPSAMIMAVHPMMMAIITFTIVMLMVRLVTGAAMTEMGVIAVSIVTVVMVV